jgi:NAD(P)H-dependent flavin oxidoreductase YrpB (nitropropane dioxygenase family)
MGVGVSNWRLARSVSLAGGMGVVSGTALDIVTIRRLQLGDPGGHMERAFAAFPAPDMAHRMWTRFYVPGGKHGGSPFINTPLPSAGPTRLQQEWTILANFAEIYLAKEGHARPIGLNLLEKIQLPTLLSLFGAMLAGVDALLMGAGIPRQILGILDRLARGEAASLKLDVRGDASGHSTETHFDPGDFFEPPPELIRPRFIAIVSSSTLALTLTQKSSGRVDGFVIEGPVAGGHNAPPRGPAQRSPLGEPIYGPRDVPDLAAFRALALPFWLASGMGRPGQLAEALKQGATGIQVGTPFAFCEESGIDPRIKEKVLNAAQNRTLEVFTDPDASPTGFPFKVVRMPGSLSDPETVRERNRICDLGFLRTLYRKPDGDLGYRCLGECPEDYIRKGGALAETSGRVCVCNGLLATIGLGQNRKGQPEPYLVTAGNDAIHLAEWLAPGRTSYTALEVINRLSPPTPASADPAQEPSAESGADRSIFGKRTDGSSTDLPLRNVGHVAFSD